MKTIDRINRNAGALESRGYSPADALVVATYLEDVRDGRIDRMRRDARVAWRVVCIAWASCASFVLLALLVEAYAPGVLR